MLVLALSGGGSSQDGTLSGSGAQTWSGPDESGVAAAVSQESQASSSLPDETGTAAAVSAGR